METDDQTEGEVVMAAERLLWLAHAALKAYETGKWDRRGETRKEMREIGEHLADLGGDGLMDKAYERVEAVAPMAVVGELTMAWQGLRGWYM